MKVCVCVFYLPVKVECVGPFQAYMVPKLHATGTKDVSFNGSNKYQEKFATFILV